MPELPEVETITNGLKEALLGRRLRSVRIYNDTVIQGNVDSFRTALQDRTLEKIDRHGKGIFATFKEANGDRPSSILKIHLGMTGQLLIEEKQKPADKHTHLAFDFDTPNLELRYRDIRKFGKLRLVTEVVSKVPDAWIANDKELFNVLRRKKGMIKHSLLNQSVLAGLGNIYVDESLHLAGIHPRKRLERLSSARLVSLCRAIRTVLGESIGLGGTSFRNYVDIRGGTGGFKGRLKVYGKQGTSCRCGRIIKKTVVAGRGTHYCPGCQGA